MITMRRLRLTTVAAVAAVAVAACGGARTGTAPPPEMKKGDSVKVVAASTWEAGLAKAAGATDIRVIVPPGVHHASDYDPKPSDLAGVAEADVVLYASSEGFAGKLKEAAGSRAKLVEVSLDNTPHNIKAEVTRLGAEFGTTETAIAWTTIFDIEYEALRKRVGRVTRGTPPVVVAQAFVAWAADLAGARPAAVYGPQPPTAGQISQLVAARPRLVLDNPAMPGGAALANLRARRVVIQNFPDHRLDMMSVYRANANAIIAALG